MSLPAQQNRSPPFTHSWPKLSFILFEISQKISKTYNFDISQDFPKFAPLPFLKFEVDPKFDYMPPPPMCILLKFDYAKFGVSNKFLEKKTRHFSSLRSRSLSKFSLIDCLSWQQRMTYPKMFYFKDGLHNFLNPIAYGGGGGGFWPTPSVIQALLKNPLVYHSETL